MSLAKPGDAVVIMCIEDIDRIIDRLSAAGSPAS